MQRGLTPGPSPAHPGAPGPMPALLLTATGAAVFAAITTEVLPVSLLPTISRSLEVSDSAGGLLVLGYAGVVAVGSIPLTALSVRWPRRTVLAAALAVMAVSTALFAASNTYGEAFAARLLAGAAHATFFSVVFAATAAAVPPGQVARAVGSVSGGNALGLALGVPLATSTGALVGWRWVFWGSALVLAGLAVVVAVVMPSAAAPAAGGEPVLAAVRGRPLLRVAAVVLVITLGHHTTYTYVSVLLLASGQSPLQVGTSLLGYGCAGVVGVVLAAVLADRHARGSLLAATAVVVVALLALGALGFSTLGSAGAVVAWGLGFGALPTLLQTVALRSSAAAPEAGSAVVNCSFNVGIAGGALLGSGVLLASGPRELPLVGAAVVAASVVMVGSRWVPEAAWRAAGSGSDRSSPSS